MSLHDNSPNGGDPRERAEDMLAAGVAADVSGEYAMAAAASAEAAAMFEQLGDAARQGEALSQLGRAKFQQGEYAASLDAHSQAADTAVAAEDMELRAASLVARAQALEELGLPEAVLRAAAGAVALARQFDFGLQIAGGLLLQGRAMRRLGRPLDALAALSESRPRYQDQDDPRWVRWVLDVDEERVAALLDLRRFEEAVALADSARRAAEAVNDPVRVANADRQFGEALLAEGSPEQARLAFEEARRLFSIRRERREAAVCDIWIGRCYRAARDWEGAIDAFRDAAAMLERLGDQRWLEVAVREESQACYRSGDLATAARLSVQLLEQAVLDRHRHDRPWHLDLATAVAASLRLQDPATAEALCARVGQREEEDLTPSVAFLVAATRHWVAWQTGNRLAALEGASELLGREDAGGRSLAHAWMLEIAGTELADQPEASGYLARALVLYRGWEEPERATVVEQRILEITSGVEAPRQGWLQLARGVDDAATDDAAADPAAT